MTTGTAQSAAEHLCLRRYSRQREYEKTQTQTFLFNHLKKRLNIVSHAVPKQTHKKSSYTNANETRKAPRAASKF